MCHSKPSFISRVRIHHAAAVPATRPEYRRGEAQYAVFQQECREKPPARRAQRLQHHGVVDARAVPGRQRAGQHEDAGDERHRARAADRDRELPDHVVDRVQRVLDPDARDIREFAPGRRQQRALALIARAAGEGEGSARPAPSDPHHRAGASSKTRRNPAIGGGSVYTFSPPRSTSTRIAREASSSSTLRASSGLTFHARQASFTPKGLIGSSATRRASLSLNKISRSCTAYPTAAPLAGSDLTVRPAQCSQILMWCVP